MTGTDLLYLYCIIETDEARDFGQVGIGGRGDMITTISYDDLSAVISRTPMVKYELNRENLMAHQKVVDGVMKDFTVLPVRFCTVAECAEDIRRVLGKRYVELKKLLREMDNKLELGVKVLWKDMNAVFQGIAECEPEIKKLKEKLSVKSFEKSYQERVSLGRMVKDALESHKKRVSDEMLNRLRPIALNTAVNKTFGDSMVLNSAFLVHGGRVKEFDDTVSGLQSSNNQMNFKYVGPVAPYNFVNIVIEWK